MYCVCLFVSVAVVLRLTVISILHWEKFSIIHVVNKVHENLFVVERRVGLVG